MTCEECRAMRAPETVPYLVHESAMARAERAAKRLWLALMVVIVLLVGTNCAWIYYESQFSDVVTTIDAKQDGGGTNIVSGGDYNGTEG